MPSSRGYTGGKSALCALVKKLRPERPLLGPGALARVAEKFGRGADLTVGEMLRTDKASSYPVDFAHPRERRGGNVWQHLRAFRQGLFDLVPDDTLHLDGEYADLAWDWTWLIMVMTLNRRGGSAPLSSTRQGGMANFQRSPSPHTSVPDT